MSASAARRAKARRTTRRHTSTHAPGFVEGFTLGMVIQRLIIEQVRPFQEKDRPRFTCVSPTCGYERGSGACDGCPASGKDCL